ncbi:MAG: hypothetical protein IJZ74_08440 [Clostridia bacterium]|nr:hypothetical protein [Clostridia bacterium]
MERCIACGQPVTPDEEAMTKKLINRGITQYQCIPCLARHFAVTEQALYERMQYFKDMGCMLFPCNQSIESPEPTAPLQQKEASYE